LFARNARQVIDRDAIRWKIDIALFGSGGSSAVDASQG
jgi:hypothetical protein